MDETKNYLLGEIKQNELIRRKHKKTCTTLNYSEHVLILTSTITGSISISSFASLLGIPIGITSSAIGLKICTTSARIRKYKSMINKKKKKHNKIVLLAKSKLNSIEVLISKALIDLNLSNDKFVLINNVLQEYDGMKEKLKKLKTNCPWGCYLTVSQVFIKQCCHIV